jgi:uncharacterized membrane protein
MTSTSTPRSLGWLSLALGLPSLLAPRAVAGGLGLDDDDEQQSTLRFVGGRELVSAAGLLSGKGARAFLWSRVAGDVDGPGAAAQAAGLRPQRRPDPRCDRRRRRAWPSSTCSPRSGTARAGAAAPMELTAATTVNKTPQEVYDFWRGLERLPQFMHHLESVEWLDERTTRWRAAAPVGQVGWDAELTEDVRGERIAWRSLPGTSVPNSGSVDLTPAPGGRGTEVRVHLSYSVPGGAAGRAVARLLGEEPHQQVEDDLRRFKQVIETGQVVRSDGSPEGHSASRQLFQRPAQPVG